MSAEGKPETTETSWWESAPPRKTTGSPLGGQTGRSNSETDSTTALAEEWIAAKADLRKSQTRLDKAVTALISECGIREDGSQSQRFGDYKITTTGTINYSVDMDSANRLLAEGILNPTLWQEIFKTRLSLGKVAYQEAISAMPELAGQIQGCVTSKSGKSQAWVEKVED